MAQRRNIIMISTGIHLLCLALLPNFKIDEKKPSSKPLALKILDQKARNQEAMVMDLQTPTAPPTREAAESWQDHKAVVNQRPKEVLLKTKEATTTASPEKSFGSQVAEANPPPKGQDKPKDPSENKGKIGALTGITQRNAYEKFLGQAGAQLLNKSMAGYESLETGDGDRLDLDTKEYRYMGYFSSMRKSIELVWVYPAEASRRGIQGTVTVEFTIEKSGASKSIKVLRSSGSESLDNAIVQAIRDAQPFSPLPEGFGKEKLTITGNFNYVLTGYAISH
jgi:protein TonB